MRYKTIFRLVLRAMGIYFMFEGLFALITNVGWAFQWSAAGSMLLTIVMTVTAGIVQITVGLYLLFGGRWLLDRVIPANRPYCPECAYDLTGAASERCPECGTPFNWDAVRPGKSGEVEALNVRAD